MRILSIDPGYERFGIAIIDKDKGKKEVVVFSDCIKTSPKIPFADRLLQIGLDLESIIEKYKPNHIAIENLFVSNNQKTAMRVSEVRGMVIYVSKKNNLDIFEYTPLQIKLAVTGDGKSTKNQVIKMINLIIKNLNKDKKLDDEYDAIAVGVTHITYTKL
jgi:crossover junction endodeoxyribonuclease RuvC